MLITQALGEAGARRVLHDNAHAFYAPVGRKVLS